PVRGRMLSGMGVPDLRGGLGTATFYTTDDSARPRESENVLRPQPVAGNNGVFSTHLIGPRNPKAGGDLRVEVTLRVDRDGGRVPPAVRPRLARARGHDAPRAGAVRRRAVLLPVRYARPDPAPVLAVPRTRSSGQSAQPARPRLRPGHR